jgi:hypothetical protein
MQFDVRQNRQLASQHPWLLSERNKYLENATNVKNLNTYRPFF